MKKIKFKIEINGKKYLMRYKYQNHLFPLFALDVFSFKLFGLYWYRLNLKESGSLCPNECVDWTLEQFKENAIKTLSEHLDLDSDTNKSIKNFNTISTLNK